MRRGKRRYVGRTPPGNTATYGRDKKQQLAVVAGKVGKFIDIRLNVFCRGKHGGYGIALPSEALADAPLGSEMAMSIIGGTAAVMTGKITAEDKYLAGAEGSDIVGGKLWLINHCCRLCTFMFY